MDTMSLRHVAVNEISSHRHPSGTSGKGARSRSHRAYKEEEERARERLEDTETVANLTRVMVDMEDPLRVSYWSEMDWNGNENENENNDGNRTWESLTSANSLADAARLHCNIELEQDKASVLIKLDQITASEVMPHSDPTSTTF
ncbi:hypothetical protein F5887DRAFT_2601 [Amanita rubescens]|nr:hypothetical protein F5887DRAFT_2601 [Amanita rubescens]